MQDIEVEAVESIDDDALLDGVGAVSGPEYILYGGKGGVGKTTCAAATALASAREGTRTLVVSTDPAHSLSDVLETPIPAEPARISDEYPLWAVEIDPSAADVVFDDEVDIGDAMAGAGVDPDDADPGAMGGMEQLFGGMNAGEPGDDADGTGAGMGAFGGLDPTSMPGADEAAAMQLLIEYLDDDRFERVVVDTAPTGHTLRLFQLPEILDSMVGRILTFRQRLSGVLGGAPGPFGDADASAQVDQLEAFADQLERLRAALRDPTRTEFRVVMVPEQLSVIESERLIRRLDDFGIPTGTVVVNQVTDDLSNVTDVDADWFVKPDLEHCEFCKRRWQSQQKALQRAQDVFRGRDIKRVPMFAEEVSGVEMLRVVAACLT